MQSKVVGCPLRNGFDSHASDNSLTQVVIFNPTQILPMYRITLPFVIAWGSMPWFGGAGLYPMKHCRRPQQSACSQRKIYRCFELCVQIQLVPLCVGMVDEVARLIAAGADVNDSRALDGTTISTPLFMVIRCRLN